VQRTLSTLVLAALAAPASSTAAQSLDYEFFKARVEPIFLTKRPGDVRCYVCHSDHSNNSFNSLIGDKNEDTGPSNSMLIDMRCG